jgi:hypothetical protein
MTRTRHLARIVLATTSLLIVAAVVALDLRRTSPGQLSRAHAGVDELEGAAGCRACHGGIGRALADGCTACHAGVGADLEHGRGLHGTLASDARACGACHLEHHGDEVALTDAASFALAGVPDPLAYDHAALGFTLGGRHGELACGACHANAFARELPAGAERFRGLSQACDACHADPHAGRMARACADCHGQEHAFEEVRAFAHAAFDAGGAHGRARCAECHAPGSEHAVEALAAAGEAPPARECTACHADPHAPELTRAAAARLAVTAEEACGRCHDPRHASFAEAPDAIDAALHRAASGFALEPPHAGLACSDCHADGAARAERYPGRRADDCAACHADPHRDEFADGPFAGARCADCHAPRAFAPAAFEVEHHARTSFDLDGSHAAVACSGCHAAEPGAPPRFDAAPRRCSACHADAHRGRLAEAPACAGCHATTTFDDVERAAFDHERSTAFRLDGAHAQVECTACHAPTDEPDAHGRRFGFAPEPSAAAACATCHADPHVGAFDAPLRPAEVAGRAGCARCHDAGSFALPPAELVAFDHALWTGYPLDGAHAGLACTACHAPAERGGVLGPAAGAGCADCHGDPHAGQFRAEERDGCARCHAVGGALVFDHDDSRFPLDARHAALACSACHLPWPLPAGGAAVRYRPLGTTCADCHGPVMRGRGGAR